MKKVLLILAVAVLLLLLPRGKVTEDQICTDCGKIRRVERIWIVSREWSWDLRGSELKDTEVARFIRKIGVPAEVHVWRPSGRAHKAGRLLPQESGLAGFDRGIAWDAVRARLRNPGWDVQDPPWYTGLGWPPSDLQEAKAWWAGVGGRVGAFSH